MLSSPVEPPLASAYLKLLRAQEHLDPLVAAIRGWENSRPYNLVRETDERAGEHVAYGVMDEPPGQHWYGPLGDTVNNLRAVLDHCVYGLSYFFAKRALTEAEAKSIYFPVTLDSGDWDALMRKKDCPIRFLPDPYREIIESEQPHRGPNEFIRTSHPMHVLHALWNVDKHRQITFFARFGKVMTVYVPGDPVPAYRVTAPVVDDGSQVVRIPIGTVTSKEDFEPIIQVEVSLRESGPPGNPVTGHRPPVGAFLGYMHNRVFGVLDAFQDRLKLDAPWDQGPDHASPPEG